MFDEGRLLVGATKGRNGNGVRGKGAAYMFELQGSTWVETRRYSSSVIEDPAYGLESLFGNDVALDGDYLAIGDPLGSASAMNPDQRGRVYVFESVVSTPTCTGVANTTGLPAELRAIGSAVASVGVVTLEGTNLPQGSGAVLFVGPLQGFTVNPGGSLGNLCISGSAQRLAQGPADAAGRWKATVELALPGALGALAVLPGESRHFQLWYRQPGAPPMSNFSSGARVDFR